MNTNTILYQFKQASIVLKIIVINTLIFLAVYLGSFFFKLSPSSFVSWFVLPTSFVEIILQPWSIITYAFLHAGFWHLFWNMYLLYWFGTYVFNLFTAKRFLTIYLLGGICGGFLTHHHGQGKGTKPTGCSAQKLSSLKKFVHGYFVTRA